MSQFNYIGQPLNIGDVITESWNTQDEVEHVYFYKVTSTWDVLGAGWAHIQVVESSRPSAVGWGHDVSLNDLKNCFDDAVHDWLYTPKPKFKLPEELFTL